MTSQGQQSDVLGKKRCPRCGGIVYVERLADSGPGQKFLEWTCIICGWTHYPGTPKSPEPRILRRNEKKAQEKKPQETKSRWTT